MGVGAAKGEGCWDSGNSRNRKRKPKKSSIPLDNHEGPGLTVGRE